MGCEEGSRRFEGLDGELRARNGICAERPRIFRGSTYEHGMEQRHQDGGGEEVTMRCSDATEDSERLDLEATEAGQTL